MAAHEKFLKDIGINFQWRINKANKKLEYRDLTGPEKLFLYLSVRHFGREREIGTVSKIYCDTLFTSGGQ